MELKVWLDGVARVVCGLSLDTSCQDVVVALAQSVGQTGRYVLIMKSRGSERQLLADDRPLQQVAQLGQQAAEVRFLLRRTGPSLSERRDKAAGKRLSAAPGLPEAEPFGHKESPKALTVSQGSSTLPRRTKSSRARSSSTASPEPRASPVSFPDAPNSVKAHVPKEEVFRQILQQQKTLQDLVMEVQALERETERLEQLTSSANVPGPSLSHREGLERRQQQNKEELIVGEQWEELLQAEMDKERGLLRRLHQVHSSVDHHAGQIQELRDRSAHIEQEVQLTAQRQRAHALQSEEALRRLKQEFSSRQQQTQQLAATLSASQTELKAAERTLQEKSGLIQVLNKELRQCNLQQFIQQTGGPHADQANDPTLGSSGE